MALNESLFVTVVSFQDYLVDKETGEAMAAGTVTCYRDTARTVLKNWYYQSGNPTDGYEYIALDNPLTLSSTGTVMDQQGNDVLPFFYPYDESDASTAPSRQAYYITVDNSGGTRQFTRINFPYVPSSGGGGDTDIPDYNNLIMNGEFWRNAGDSSGTVSGGTSTVLALSQHDGFSMADIRFIKDVDDGTDTITFTKFVGSDTGSLENGVQPEWFMNVTCTSVGTSTYKYVQIPLQLHLDSLSEAVGVFTMQLRAASVSASNTVTVKLYSFYGTGATTPAQDVLSTETATTSWTRTEVNVPFPNTDGFTLGDGGDDAYYIQLGFEAGETFSVDIAMPQFFLGNTASSTAFRTYGEIDAFINSPRTGDIRQGMNTAVANLGWVSCNDGTIGNYSSNATARAATDTWPLFNRLWTLFSVYTHSTTNDVCQMYTSAGAAVAYGASAIDDFSANRQLSLPKFESRTILGTPPATPAYTYSASDSGGNLLVTVSSTATFYVGQPVGFQVSAGGTTPGNLSINEIAYIASVVNSTTMLLATTYANALSGTYIAYSSAGTGTQSILNAVPGTILGENAHAQLTGEVGVHQHTLSSGGLLVTSAGETVCSSLSGSGAFATLVPDSTSAGGTGVYGLGGSTDNTAAATAFNVMQPSVYMFTLMKL